MGSILFQLKIPLSVDSLRPQCWRINRTPIYLIGRLSPCNTMVEFWVNHHDGDEYLGKARLCDLISTPIDIVLNAITQFWLNQSSAIIPSRPFFAHLQAVFVDTHCHDTRIMLTLHEDLKILSKQLVQLFLVGLRVVNLELPS